MYKLFFSPIVFTTQVWSFIQLRE